jgi:hypothetical protein
MTQISNPIANTAPPTGGFPRELMGELWMKIAQRLSRGETLITHDHFLAAMEQEFRELTGQEITAQVRKRLLRSIVAVNNQHPETYLVQGVQNGIQQAFGKGVLQLNWDESKIQSKGTPAIRRFERQDNVRDLLEEVNVKYSQIDSSACVKYSMEVLFQQGNGNRPLVFSPPPLVEPLPLPPEPESKIPEDPEVQAAIELGDVDPVEAEDRLKEQEASRETLEKREQEKADERLHVYVAQGTLTDKEAEDLRELRQIDKRQERGEINAVEADNIRNSILDSSVRDSLGKRVKEAVDHAVRYLQVYEAMQKIGKQNDEALAFLIGNKDTIVADKPDPIALAEIIGELSADEQLLEGIMAIVDRSDQEIRMMSVRLPPYNYIMSRGLEKIGNMTIEGTFLEELRRLDSEEISERLHSADAAERVQPAADMRCLISLVDHVTKRTRFRKEIRMLRLGQSIEEFYRSTSDLNEARHQAENFMKRRLRRLFPDMPTEEAVELRQQSAEIISAIEQKILQERQAEIEEQRRRTAGATTQSRGAADDDDENDLTDEEMARGIQIGRVEMRVAGRYRRVPHRIMPDPDDPGRFVIAARDDGTGELEPAIRRGSKRYVAKDRDGTWKVE